VVAVVAWWLWSWGVPGSAIGSQTWSGTDWPAQWYPQSSTHPVRAATDVVAGSNVTVAVWDSAFASTASTPGRRSSAFSITASEVAQCRPPTCTTVV